jgi:hypothetical protein
MERNALLSLVLSAFAVGIAPSFSGACSHGGGSTMIVWPHTSQYDAKVRTLQLSPQSAHALLVERTRAHPDRFFDQAPLFIIEDEYFFAEPRKTETRLQGFYVNGNTGVIEYKTSTKVLKRGARYLPDNAYQSSTVLGGP